MADRIFNLANGRGISFSAAGDALARRLVLLCLPIGVAGAFDPDPLITDRWGVRLIMLDRPGYASSGVLADGEVQSVQSRADDLDEFIRTSEAIADRVSKADFDAIGAIGWGSGAPFAATLAARHPDLVDRLALVGAAAPHRVTKDERRSGLIDAVHVRGGMTLEEAAAVVDQHDWNAADAVGVADDDGAFESISGLWRRVERAVAEAATQGSLGVAADLLALRDESWTDDLGDITANTLIVTGGSDSVAGEKDAAWWAKRIPSSTVRTSPGAGHLVVATEWERILDHVAPKHGGLPPEVRG